MSIARVAASFAACKIYPELSKPMKLSWEPGSLMERTLAPSGRSNALAATGARRRPGCKAGSSSSLLVYPASASGARQACPLCRPDQGHPSWSDPSPVSRPVFVRVFVGWVVGASAQGRDKQ